MDEGNDVPEAQLLEWVLPFYMSDPGNKDFIKAFEPVAQNVSEALVRQLLSVRNWRPRIVGGYFAAIFRMESMMGLLEPLLLRSEVTFAGRGYCLALASINTAECPQILSRYLDHYLARPDLWFDQSDALAALTYLDVRNGTTLAEAYGPAWQAFVANKPFWDLNRSKKRFAASLQGAERCREIAGL